MNKRFWERTLRNLAAHFGVEAQVQTQVVCVDRGWQWSRAGNVWQNAYQAKIPNTQVSTMPAGPRIKLKPVFKGKEDVADGWSGKLLGLFYRRHYWYLMPLFYPLRMYMKIRRRIGKRT